MTVSVEADELKGRKPLGSTWFALRRYSSEIREFTVTKSTSVTVWYLDRDWENKETGRTRQERRGGNWFPTRLEALTAMRNRLKDEVQSANARYSRAVEALKTFNSKHAGELG